MRLQWCIVLLSAVSLAHTLEIKEGSKKNIQHESKEKLSEHCSEFIESCFQLWYLVLRALTTQLSVLILHILKHNSQDETIEAFSTSCSAREATCHCNEKDVSAMIYQNLLSKVEQQPAQIGKKKELQVETDDSMLSPVQFKAVASPDDEQDALMDEEAFKDYQQMEFIYPRHEIMKNPAFQQGFCSKFLMRCKQDCSVAFSS